ncbi:MAG: Gfo/Idh/MocA family oxidoreductase [Anaerolineae bacterium]|nr:Gfo/Idh/MocA family oxidoreductase [Anaerolineae bacterium]
MTRQIGIAIIGSGYWGINYIRVFEELAGARVVVVCDQDSNRLQEVGRRFPNVKLVDGVDGVIQDDDVEAVVICTQAKFHHALARRCIEAGKHVLVEKPITTTVDDAEDLINLASAKNTKLMVGYTFVYNAGIRKMKSFVSESLVGQVYYLYARRTNLGPIRRDVNALWDLAPHDISIFNFLLDSVPEWVSAVGVKALGNGREDVGFVSLGYPNGVVGHIHVSWADPNKVREVVVVGSDRRIVFDDLNALERVKIYEKGVTSTSDEATNYGEFQIEMRDGDIISPKVEISEPLKTQCTHFLECISNNRLPLTDGQAGKEVVQVMEAIDYSLQHNGAPVRVGLEKPQLLDNSSVIAHYSSQLSTVEQGA